ncbi:MAG: CDP-diacylglycerol--glycerol-3-phosphate 3-phosphatidyltransferase [Thomasclavelia sp.]|nr:CDP-diacylglycerol--glycerol-3-phosphate 3-phosphatidyltransferase [Thomasclavelia sp.]
MTLPNKLTIIRIILVPILLLIYVFPYAKYGIYLPTYSVLGSNISLLNLITLLIFGIASFTDYLDGRIARENKLITTFGKFADPIADKLLINTILLLLADRGYITIVIPIIMIWRDMIVDAIRLVAANKNKVIAASKYGKLKTASQMLGVVLLLLSNFPFSYLGIRVDLIVIVIATIVSLISGFEYFWKNKDIILESI